MKTKLVWKKEYEIGDYEIDAEHQIFLKIIMKIANAYQYDSNKEYIILLLKELYKYAEFHFTSEENKMILNKYPDYDLHKREHMKLLSELSDKIGFFTLKYIDQNKLIDFLINWFVNHTTDLDMKFGKYLREV